LISTINRFAIAVAETSQAIVRTGQLTHLYGPPKSGKTTLSANIALSLAKAGGKVAIVSTERPIEIRMLSILESDDSLAPTLLEHILTTEEYSFQGLYQLLTTKLSQITAAADLLIIDSLTAAYRSVASPQTLTLIRKALAALRALIVRTQKAILFTNQVSSRMDSQTSFRPVASATVRNYSDITLRLTKTFTGQSELSFEDVNGIELAVLPLFTIGARGFEEFNQVFEIIQED